MDAYRIADSRYPIFDATGAALNGGRWNSVGVIYASESFAGAMLEVLVHRNAPSLPKHHKSVRIHIPDTATIETFDASALPGWDAADEAVARAFGDEWYRSSRTVILRVPSVVTHGPEFNLLINTLHPEFASIKADPPLPVLWDARLSK